MIGQSVKLTTIRGIDMGVHYSWFIVFVLITVSLTARFASEHPHWTQVEHYAVGIATSLLFFVSILLHELAHSFVALAKHVPVCSITLFVFGGVAQIGREPGRPLTEFQIAIARPIAGAGVGRWIRGPFVVGGKWRRACGRAGGVVGVDQPGARDMQPGPWLPA